MKAPTSNSIFAFSPALDSWGRWLGNPEAEAERQAEAGLLDGLRISSEVTTFSTFLSEQPGFGGIIRALYN